MSSIAELLGQAESAVRAAEDLAALDAVRVQFLGKKGVLTAQLRELGKLPPAEIKAAGKAINDAKAALETAIDARRDALEASPRVEQPLRLELPDALAADAMVAHQAGAGQHLQVPRDGLARHARSARQVDDGERAGGRQARDQLQPRRIAQRGEDRGRVRRQPGATSCRGHGA